MIETSLYEHLKANVPLISERVFANVFHRDTPKPALVYTVVSERQGASISGNCDSDKNPREWVIHTYAEGYTENKLVKNEVIAALKTFETFATNIVIEDVFDADSELYVQQITFHTGKGK